MYKVKFAVSVKYAGKLYPAHSVIEVSADDIEHLKQEGAIILQSPPKQEDNSVEVEIRKLMGMTVKQLNAYAKENNITIPEGAKKPDIYNTIVKSLE